MLFVCARDNQIICVKINTLATTAHDARARGGRRARARGAGEGRGEGAGVIFEMCVDARHASGYLCHTRQVYRYSLSSPYRGRVAVWQPSRQRPAVRPQRTDLPPRESARARARARAHATRP